MGKELYRVRLKESGAETYRTRYIWATNRATASALALVAHTRAVILSCTVAKRG
jgi:hypothetical protein